MNNYRLITDGDLVEKECWNLFIEKEFPNYELFWLDYVLPLTNRPKDIHFKTNQELQQIGKNERHICVAQLHYSILRHLEVVFHIKSVNIIDLDKLTDGMVRICGALDNAFELLERFSNPVYTAWIDGKTARRQWQKKNNHPLSQLRNYRNHLIHGRLTPSIISSQEILVPNFGKEQKYFDWRLITDSIKNPGMNLKDLKPTKEILNTAWNETINYLETNWNRILLKGKTLTNLSPISATYTSSISSSNIPNSGFPKSGSMP